MCRVELPPMGFSAARSSQAPPKALRVGHLSSPILLRGFHRAYAGASMLHPPLHNTQRCCTSIRLWRTERCWHQQGDKTVLPCSSSGGVGRRTALIGLSGSQHRNYLKDVTLDLGALPGHREHLILHP